MGSPTTKKSLNENYEHFFGDTPTDNTKKSLLILSNNLRTNSFYFGAPKGRNLLRLEDFF